MRIETSRNSFGKLSKLSGNPDSTVVDLRKKIFSATEEQESSDDPTCGLGRWFKVVNLRNGGLENLGSICQWSVSWSKV